MNPARTVHSDDVTQLVAVIRGVRSQTADITWSSSSADSLFASGCTDDRERCNDAEADFCRQSRQQSTTGMQFNDVSQTTNEQRLMDENAATFFAQVHTQLATLQGRIDSLSRNVGTTCHLLQQRLNELRGKSDATEQVVMKARCSMEAWLIQSRFEAKAQIDQWIQNHESAQLNERAKMSRDFAVLAIVLAENSIDEAERMILEAVAMRQDADAAGCQQRDASIC